MEEIWEDIEGYEGLYTISNFGNVKSLRTNHVLKPETVRRGYKAVYLQNNGQRKHFYIHILVAKAFISNPNNYPLVNHKDENPANNSVENLEWCTYRYNNAYNDAHIKRGLTQGNNVFQYDQEGNLIKTYFSAREAARTLNKSSGNISSCCRNDKLTAYGCVWSYCELTRDEVLERFVLNEKRQRNHKNNALSKKVLQFDKDMNFITSYPSTQEAGRQLGINPSRINGVCRGVRRSTHNFIFKYEEATN